MNYLSTTDILVIHSEIIDATCGSHGIRDTHLLSSIVEIPKTILFGSEQFPGVFEKAAIYSESIAQYHVFVDGNKRTSVVATARFLNNNGYTLTATNEEVEKIAPDVATKNISFAEIVSWLTKRSEKL